MPSKKIPEGWNDYSSLGRRIEKTRFVCFKVPLKKDVLTSQRIPEEKRFSPEDLIQQLADRDEKLGLVIDLTNTDRYYNPRTFTELGIDHKKIFTEGRIVPQPPVTNKFTEHVNEFIKENEDNDKLIGVHCTHGLNRTGYIVCRHMVDHMNFTPEDALKAFNTARGHEVERENFINALHGRPYVDPPINQMFSKARHNMEPIPASRARSRSPHRAPRHESHPSRGRPHQKEGRPRGVERPPRRMDWPSHGERPRRREEGHQQGFQQGSSQHRGRSDQNRDGPSRYHPTNEYSKYNHYQHAEYSEYSTDNSNWRRERTQQTDMRMRQPEHAHSNLDRRRGYHGNERFPDGGLNNAAPYPASGVYHGDNGHRGNRGYRGRGHHSNGGVSHHGGDNRRNNTTTYNRADMNWRPTKNEGQGQGRPQSRKRDRRNQTPYQRHSDSKGTI